MVTAFIGLGSNLGDREGMIRAALKCMESHCDVRLIAVSPLENTTPIGPQHQPDFLNGVALIETDLEPLELLDFLLAIETSLGRVRAERWGPRTIDLDILTYGDRVMDLPRLKVPHPELPNRPFLTQAIAGLKGAAVHA